MAYTVTGAKTGGTYYLHEHRERLKGGQETVLYYFAKELREGAMDHLPEGYEPNLNTPNGHPVLRKKR
jgi:hypothetical protein